MVSTAIDNLYLFIYILLWFFSISIYRYKVKQNTMVFALLFLYTSIALLCPYLFNNVNAYKSFEGGLSLVGFIYLYLMILVSMIPLFTLKEYKLKYIKIPSKNFTTTICVLLSIFCIYSIICVIPKIQQGLLVILSGADDILDLYEESTSLRKDAKSFSGTIHVLDIFSSISEYLMPLFFYIYLLLKKRNKFVVAIMIVGLLEGTLIGIANASRFQMVLQPFIVLLLYFFFKPYLEQTVVRTMKRLFVVFSAFILAVFLIVTIARENARDDESNVTYGLVGYYAMGPLMFDNYCMNANGTREGYFTFPLFVHLAGGKSYSESELRQKYSHMKIDNSKFSTYVGDFVLDYGPFWAAVLFVFFTIFARGLLKHNYGIGFHQVIIVYIVLRVCSGFYQYQLGTVSGNLSVICLLFLAFCYYNKGFGFKQIIVERDIN